MRAGVYGLAITIFLVVLAMLPVRVGAAEVEGRVLDQDGSGVSLGVILEVHDGQQIVYQSQGSTDESGVVRWADVPDSEGLHARLRGNYDGAEYISPSVPLENGAGSVTLTVLPVAREGRPLHLDTLHLIVQTDDPGLLRVLQFMTVSNAGVAAFAGGPVLSSGVPSGLVIPLPVGATNVRPAPFPNAEAALTAELAQFDSDRVLDARPVPPGGRQVAVTYELTVPSGGADVALLLPYPTQTVSLMLGGGGREILELSSDQLMAQQAEMIGDQQYDLWTAEALAPGIELRFNVGPPGISLTPAQIGMLGSGLGLLLAVAGSIFGGVSKPYAARQRQVILAAIAELDDAHDAGTVEERDYFVRRGKHLERLALLDGSDEATTGAAA